MALGKCIILVMSVATSLGQRPFFAGNRPIGYPDITTSTAAGDLGNRFGEGDASTTTQRLPVEAHGDRDVVDRLSKLPKDQQPFWLLNWQALEANRRNPQTYPQKPNSFAQPLAPSNPAPSNPAASNPATVNRDGISDSGSLTANANTQSSSNNGPTLSNGNMNWGSITPVADRKPLDNRFGSENPTNAGPNPGDAGEKVSAIGSNSKVPVNSAGNGEQMHISPVYTNAPAANNKDNFSNGVPTVVAPAKRPEPALTHASLVHPIEFPEKYPGSFYDDDSDDYFIDYYRSLNKDVKASKDKHQKDSSDESE